MSLKFYLLRDLQNIIPVTEFIADIYKKNSDPAAKYHRACQRYARISELVIKIGYGIYSISLVVLSGVPELILTGEIKPCLNIYIPGIYAYSTTGYILIMAYNYYVVYISFLTTPIGDMLFFIIFANIPMAPVVIRGQLDELRDRLETNMASMKAIKFRIMQYILMHHDYNE